LADTDDLKGRCRDLIKDFKTRVEKARGVSPRPGPGPTPGPPIHSAGGGGEASVQTQVYCITVRGMAVGRLHRGAVANAHLYGL
jgi:hypothetical protein